MSRVSFPTRMILAVSIAAFSLLSSPISSLAGQNADFRFVLHAKQSTFETCNGYLPVDCTTTQPTVNVPSGVPIAVFLLLANYQEATQLQTALTWPGWNFGFKTDCLFICDFPPCDPPNPPQPLNIAGTFSCITGPALRVVSVIHFFPGAGGCIRQVLSTFPFGTHLGDCTGGFDMITEEDSPRLGRVCTVSGGVNACPPVTPVESATWGSIKATY